jgi:hypothetical protein
VQLYAPTSFTQRVKIDVAKLREYNRILKFANRRITDARERDSAGMRPRYRLGVALRRGGVRDLFGFASGQVALLIAVEWDDNMIGDVHRSHVLTKISRGKIIAEPDRCRKRAALPGAIDVSRAVPP